MDHKGRDATTTKGNKGNGQNMKVFESPTEGREEAPRRRSYAMVKKSKQ